MPQCVPFATLTVDPHTGWPVVHEIVPVWQRSPPGLQVMFGVQALQVPLKQLKFVPHDIPLATLPVDMHTDEPVAQDVVPVAQTFPPGMQSWFGVQVLQLPFEQ